MSSRTVLEIWIGLYEEEDEEEEATSEFPSFDTPDIGHLHLSTFLAGAALALNRANPPVGFANLASLDFFGLLFPFFLITGIGRQGNGRDPHLASERPGSADEDPVRPLAGWQVGWLAGWEP